MTLSTELGLKYRPDWLEARERLTTWWNGGDIGRAAMQLVAPREEPWEEIAALSEPPDWITWYSTKDYNYRINSALRSCLKTKFLAEAVPNHPVGDLAPNCVALYLGCRGVEMPGTVWCEPFLSTLEGAKFAYDPDNFYWQFSQRAYTEVAGKGKGKFLQQFPDFIEGLDTLAAIVGTEELLEALIEHPDWVHAALRQVTDLYFHYYDVIYDIVRDEVGGSVFWAWAPGRMVKLQCDFSAMISPDMFGEFMVPVLTEMTERVSYSMYHWDGPGALNHLDHLLSIPRLNMIQWTPGAGAEPGWHPRWWPYYHRIIDAGKKIYVFGFDDVDQLYMMRKEFDEGCKQLLVNAGVKDEAQADAYMAAMTF
jgi:5-methyltetrahydrofolate--homocysteine methyltransferase